MQDKHLFEYAVVRVVPRVEREEFMNAGVILYCPSKGYLKSIYHVNNNKLLALYPDIEPDMINEYLNAFIKICTGGENGGPIGRLSISSRFRWLTATRSTVVQTSMVHLGFCNEPAATHEKLFMQLVL